MIAETSIDLLLAAARVLVEASLRIAIVAAVAALTLRLLRIESRAMRHRVWATIVVAMLLMPAVPYLVPAFTVPALSPVLSSPALVDEMPIVGGVSLSAPLVVATRPIPRTTASISLPEAARPLERGEAESIAPRWISAAAVIYAAALLMLAIRATLAIRFMRRLRHASRQLAALGARVFESPMAVAPVTVGVFKPWIVLPLEWRTWSADKLAGVLAHEEAHIARRDPIVSLCAHLNRAIFWFHPLAWWLERTIAACAEDAADDAGAAMLGERRAYAEVLIDMAASVRRERGRMAWQGLGVSGNGSLSRRIDRLLAAPENDQVSVQRKVATALAVAASILVAVSCKAIPSEPPPLIPDPAMEASAFTRSEEFRQLSKMTKQDVDALELAVRNAPEDFANRRKLLMAYRLFGTKLVGAEAGAVKRRSHTLWLIEHQPDGSETALWTNMYQPVNDIDPDGYEEGKRLWLAHANGASPTQSTLNRAALFLERGRDLELAERVVLQAQDRFPSSPAWTDQLASIYAAAIAGAEPVRGSGPSIRLNEQRQQLPYAVSIRARLDTTRDAVLLASVGDQLNRTLRASDTFPYELVRLVHEYIQRAFALNPADARVASAERTLRVQGLMIRGLEMWKAAGKDPVKQLDAIFLEPPDQRFRLLANFAVLADQTSEVAQYYSHDAARAARVHDAAKRAANAVIAMAEQFKDDPSYGPNVFAANVALSFMAMRAGSRVDAVKFLRAAVDVPPSPEFGGGWSFFRHTELTNHMLKYGERESVADFYAKLAELLPPTDSRRPQMKDAAAAIRAGRMPFDYQRFVERERLSSSLPR